MPCEGPGSWVESQFGKGGLHYELQSLLLLLQWTTTAAAVATTTTSTSLQSPLDPPGPHPISAIMGLLAAAACFMASSEFRV